MALVVGLWGAGTRDHSTIVFSQQVSASAGLPASPLRHCPLGSLAQNSGTCVSILVVGIESATVHMPPIEPKSTRLTLAAAPAVAKCCGSPLERPPRS